MAAIAFETSAFEEQLVCSICLEQYKDPRILPCHHSFCMRCLTDHPIKEENGMNSIVCPTCREPTRIPDEGIAALPSAFFINSFLELQKKILVVNTGHSTQDTAGSLCPDHGKPMDTYCNDCDKVICHHCAIKQHRRHECDLASEVYDKCMNPVYQRLDEIESQVKHADSAIHKLDERLEAQREKMETTKKEVNDEVDKIIRKIQQSKMIVIKEMEDRAAKRSRDIQNRKDEFLGLKKKINISASVRQLLRKGQKEAILAQRDRIMHQLEFSEKLVSNVPRSVLDLDFESDEVIQTLEDEFDEFCGTMRHMVEKSKITDVPCVEQNPVGSSNELNSQDNAPDLHSPFAETSPAYFKLCPVCYHNFPGRMLQSDFERHVNSHF